MYSVLIVDDEEPVLDSYRYLIETVLEGFVVCGTARSGSEAIKTAQAHAPDVVLMDIAMPGIDGLDTLAELQRDYPDVLCILSSAYERFDLAQRAIPLQVFAYLVKPVSRKRFTETMYRAKDKLDERAVQVSKRLETVEHGEETLARERERLILGIPWRKFDDVAWSPVPHLFHLSSDYAAVLLVEARQRELFPQLVDRLERRFRCLWGEHLQRLVVLVSGTIDVDRLAGYLESSVLSAFAPATGITYGIGSSRRYDELFRSYDEALSRLPNREDAVPEVLRFQELVADLAQATARTRVAEDLEQRYQRISDFAVQHWVFPVAITRIAGAFQRILEDFGARLQDPRVAVEVADPAADIAGFRSVEDLDAWARRVIRRITELQARFGPSQWPTVVRQAVAYIDMHYAEQLHLSLVAERCGVSPGHLSRLFSEHVSMSLTEYVNTVRIEQARGMLSAGSASVKDVSYSVGFHDPNYFGRIFKRITGVSPSEYAKEVSEHG